MRTVVTFGTYDLFHVGHLRLLERAAAHGDRLIVGVSSDALNVRKKGYRPVFPQADRLAIVAGLRCVDAVFVEESLEEKAAYLAAHDADVLVMGDDWSGHFDHLDVEVVYLPRTDGVSTTDLKRVIALGDQPL